MSDTSLGLKEFFTLDHRRCDEKWIEVEAAAQAGDSEISKEKWRTFESGMLRHLRMEEEVMFPAFEQASGMTGGGPTFVMRSEHEQMRGLLEQMAAAANGEDYDELVDLGDTLLMLIQQHNQKEEQMLYPMAEQALTAEWAKIAEKLTEY
ncbi:MAG: hemerythrin HHE cation-binding protein [Deltaproteobacteria bacterium]|jgi:iron-sulfur cluster repair protein YtfE (RIC family)|nr:hemerythrin HHE cation-binding protein [Deltaproteobacteria bacterium]